MNSNKTMTTSKSLNDFNKAIAKYEIIVSVIIQKIRKILSLGFSYQLLDDYEFLISAQTLLRMDILPRHLKHIRFLYKRYSSVSI